MNKYEAMYIIKPTVEAEARTAVIEKFSQIISANGGNVETVEELGMRKLAYEINYIGEGFYVLVNFTADAALPAELERNFRINENIMRYIVIKKEA
ncbi:MAG: 30S ribosomal protein S6 [Clostridia bacterium]|nr:30S ribosomal protein S6 [Clostridia bacterium]